MKDLARVATTVAVLTLAFAGSNRLSAQDELIRKIINGLPTTDYPSVGIVGSVDLGGFCTGTLISPTHVLTAAHCAEEIQDETMGTFELDGQVYLTARVIIHPDYNTFTLANDIAVLELAEPVETVMPSIIATIGPEIGQEVTIVGYGSGGTGDTGEDGVFGTKLVGTTTLDTVEPTVITALFDSNDESNPAPGDSGGPLFAIIDGVEVIVGIVSAGTIPDASLGDNSIDTRVDAFATWIDDAVAGVVDGEPPTDEPPTDEPPTDEPPTDEPPTDEPPADDPVACPPVTCCWTGCCWVYTPCAPPPCTTASDTEASANNRYRVRPHRGRPSSGLSFRRPNRGRPSSGLSYGRPNRGRSTRAPAPPSRGRSYRR